MANSNSEAKQLLAIPGIDSITATALVCSIGDGKQFKRDREFSAWLGVTTKQPNCGDRKGLLGLVNEVIVI